MYQALFHRWQGIERFVKVNNIPNNPCNDWEHFKSEQGDTYLVSANIKSRRNKILKAVTR